MELEHMPIEHSSSEQHHADPPDDAVSSSSEQQNTGHDDESIRESDMIPKQNKVDRCLESKKIRVFVGCLLTVLAMVAGIIIVCFTAPKPRMKCDHIFKRTMPSSPSFSSQPKFVASGDLNNDHLTDLVVANSGTNTIGIFFRQGNGTFAEQQTYSTGYGSRPLSVTIGDCNNDSYADIIVANYNTNNVGLFFGYENGTFADQKLISLGASHPLFITHGDFNKDNRMDLAVVNYGTDTISILFGYGNGSFRNPINYSTDYDSLPSSLAVGDFNNDTYLDIAVANAGTDNIGIFINYGNGTFTNQQIYTTGINSNPSSIALGDFNSDHILDIVVANYGTGSVGIFFGFDNGTFLSQISYIISPHAYPEYVTVSAYSKINALNIIIVDSQNDHIYVLPGYGNGSFATIATYDTISGFMPVWIAVDDFNKNKQADVIVANYGANNVLVLMDYFETPSTRQTNYHGGDSGMLCGIAVSDFNNDSIIDIVFNAANYITILFGIGDSTFDKQKTYVINDQSKTQYVCTGDVNNDNHIDILVVDQGLNGVDVFLGYGNGSFGAVKTFSTGVDSNPWWIALGDFNDDGVLDMVSANRGTNSIGILLGNGNGNFTLTNYYYVARPYSVAVGDIDNDNHLDIVSCTQNGVVYIYVGTGNSTFVLMVKYVTGFGESSVAISLDNLNGDNYLDMIVANTFGDTISTSLGYGNGTFAPQTIYVTGSGSLPYYAIVADCNNDNTSDIVATLFGSSEVVIFYGYGNGSFYLARNYSTGFNSKPYGIVAADLDNDTHLEFVVTLYSTGDIAILTEYNAAEFITKTIYSTGSSPQPTSVAVADFNNDNQSDIVVANSGRDSLGVFLASSNDTFGMEMIYPIGTGSSPQYVITYDINKDNHIDIVSVNSKNNSISLIMGYGNGSFAQQVIYPTGDNSYPSSVVVNDVNNDNQLDLVIVNQRADSIGIFYGYNYTSFQTQQTYFTINNLNPRAITVNDFNNDNILDIAATFFASDSWCIFLGYGDGSFMTAQTYSLPKGSLPRGIVGGDFNNDNQSDIVIANFWSDNIGVLFGYGNGSFSNITFYSTGDDSYPIAVACGDFNNDDRLDIVVANYYSNSIGIFLGYRNGSFGTMITYSTGQRSTPYAVALGDFNSDGRLDIAVANSEARNVGVLLGYGNGSFTNQMTFSSGYGSRPVWISVGDFNQDSHLDLATANYNGDSVNILLGYGNGSFASVVTYSAGAGSKPQCISVGDFNNDNISDIVVTNYGSNTIVVLFGLGDGSFLLGTAYTTGAASLPWALANGDFNNDGQLDVAVANSQTSTIGVFLASGSHLFAGMTNYRIGDGLKPHSLALGHFNNDSWVDIVVANYGTNSIGILLGRSHGKFTDLQPYSTGSNSGPYFVAVDDFNNDTCMDITVSNFKSDNIVIFLGDGSGQFRNGETYSTGTQSRPSIVTIGDFNNDNISDIAVANSGTNNVLLFYGYGNGTFGNQTLYPFGYGSRPYSIAVGDLNEDNWMDLVIGCYGTNHVETLIKMC